MSHIVTEIRFTCLGRKIDLHVAHNDRPAVLSVSVHGHGAGVVLVRRVSPPVSERRRDVDIWLDTYPFFEQRDILFAVNETIRLVCPDMVFEPTPHRALVLGYPYPGPARFPVIYTTESDGSSTRHWCCGPSCLQELCLTMSSNQQEYSPDPRGECLDQIDTRCEYCTKVLK